MELAYFYLAVGVLRINIPVNEKEKTG